MHNGNVSQTDRGSVPASVKSIYPPLLLALVTGLLLYFASEYGETARKLPILVASASLVLIVLDLVSRFRGNVGALVRSSLGADFDDPEMQHDPDWRSEVVHFLWVSACVASIVLVGILVTVPIFIFLYATIQGKQGVTNSLIVAALGVVVIALVFEVFLEYDLYRGMLLNQVGIE